MAFIHLPAEIRGLKFLLGSCMFPVKAKLESLYIEQCFPSPPSSRRDKRLIKYISRATEMIKTVPRIQLLQKVGVCFRERLPQRNMERQRELKIELSFMSL